MILANLSVLFEVPNWIEQGLLSGNLQRVGGVIVDGGSKRVVAWLRDGGSVNQVLDLATKLPSPLSTIMNAARTGATIWDGRMTRNAIAGVSNQIAGVSNQLQNLTALTSFMATGQLLNLALTAATFHATMQRLEKLSQEVAKLGESIRIEFDRDRDISFRTALQDARDAFKSTNEYNSQRAIHAGSGLFAARENFLHDFDVHLNTGKLLVAQHCLIRAIYAETCRIQCFLRMDDLDLAKNNLLESVPLFRQKSHLLIEHWLGKHPAVFFHKDVSMPNLERFIGIQRWLYQDDPFTSDDDAHILFMILEDLRGDFWNQAVIEDKFADPLNRLVRRPIDTFKDRLGQLVSNLDQAELIIENYQRLLGFELELRSMNLKFNDWSRLVADEELQQHGIGIIVDTDYHNSR